jgi:hypothetical protein
MKYLIIFALLFSPLAEAKIKRSYKAKSDFAKIHACPSTGLNKPSCPGWRIDHPKPLACGGPDTPDNMQWLTIYDWQQKSKWERKGC